MKNDLKAREDIKEVIMRPIWSRFGLRKPKVEIDEAHDDLFNVFSRLHIIFHRKPLFHLGPGPSLPKRWHWVACARASNEAIATEIVMILLLASGLRLIQQLVHVTEAFCAWL